MTTTVFLNGRSQAVRIPKDFRFDSKKVSIRRLGDGLILEPIKCATWPDSFFDDILITDEKFARPSQGELPASPKLQE